MRTRSPSERSSSSGFRFLQDRELTRAGQDLGLVEEPKLEQPPYSRQLVAGQSGAVGRGWCGSQSKHSVQWLGGSRVGLGLRGLRSGRVT